MLSRLQTENKTKEPEDLIDFVNMFMTEYGVSIPYFVAGGSVFSLWNKRNEYSDIDVFLYSEKDASKLPKNFGTKTENAITYSFRGTIIQFIVLKYGTPEELLPLFDFNTSMIAIDHRKRMHYGKDFSDIITIENFSTFKSNSLERYKKYITEKGASDHGDITVHKIFDFLIEKDKDLIPNNYTEAKPKSAYEVLNDYFINPIKHKKHSIYIRDKASNFYSGNELIEFFENVHIFTYEDSDYFTPELFIAKRNYFSPEKFRKILEKRQDIKEIIFEKYPEYLL